VFNPEHKRAFDSIPIRLPDAVSGKMFRCDSRYSARPALNVLQVQADSHWYQEGKGIVHEYVNLVIGRLEKADDEQVVEHNSNNGPCHTDHCVIGEGKVPCPEPPPGNCDCDRGKYRSDDPAHAIRERGEEQQQRCEIPKQPEPGAEPDGIFDPLLHT
jgi:hypothetical protein